MQSFSSRSFKISSQIMQVGSISSLLMASDTVMVISVMCNILSLFSSSKSLHLITQTPRTSCTRFLWSIYTFICWPNRISLCFLRVLIILRSSFSIRVLISFLLKKVMTCYFEQRLHLIDGHFHQCTSFKIDNIADNKLFHFFKCWLVYRFQMELIF